MTTSRYSHYDYLDDHLNLFWQKYFGISLSDGGLISAVSNKGYGYKRAWEETGINFNRGMLLYLLTYTDERGDWPKSKSKEWVIEFYEKYRPIIEEVEREVGKVELPEAEEH